MLTISWSTNAEPLVSRGVLASSNRAVRDRVPEFVEGWLHGEPYAVAATAPAPSAHFVSNPLVPRPRAKLG